MTAKTKTSFLLTIFIIALLAPLAADAAVFQNPLQGKTLVSIVQRAILWLLGLAGFLALLALVMGGIYLIAGGFITTKEGQIKQGKQIILWAIIGLVIIGMAAAILLVVGQILGLRQGFIPPTVGPLGP